ncbi:MAG: ROK family protein [Halanaerobiales bacterium]
MVWRGGIGHTIFKENGYSCRCGKRGCVENYVNGRAME